MLAAYHGSPVLRIGDAPGNPADLADRIEKYRQYMGDYYHGSLAMGHLPDAKHPLTWYLKNKETPPPGLDAKLRWMGGLYQKVHNWIKCYGLDIEGNESYAIVAPRNDIGVPLHRSLMGNNSYAGHIPGTTPARTSAYICRSVLYPALIFANPGRDIATSQFMNFPDGGTWTCNDGSSYRVYSSQVCKEYFTSHGRNYEGHCIWDNLLERRNEGALLCYYSGHGTGGSGISAQPIKSQYSKYPDQVWWDSWRGYLYDNWMMPRDTGRRWYNPEPPNLYDIIHFKWVDQQLENLHSAMEFWMSCTTAAHYGPMVYLDHGAVLYYGNAGSGLCPEADLLDDWVFEDVLVNGLSVSQAYAKYLWLHDRDYTTMDPTSIYGPSSTYPLTSLQCIYGDPTITAYSPEWTEPEPISP
jgi:hypothetical protein